MTRTLTEKEGYVVHVAAYKENDAMIALFTPEGRLSFLARGIQKPTSKNAASCQLLSYSRFSLESGKNGGLSLKEGISLKVVDGKDSLQRLTAYSFLSELTAKLIQDDEAVETYPWLKAAMESLEKDADPFSVALVYFAHLLIIAGYGLDVDECIYCQGKSGIQGVSYADGGFVCHNDMSDGITPLDARHLKILRYIFRSSLTDIARVSFSKEECQGFFQSLAQYLNDLTGVELKSVALLLKA
jgi:DNA repair protein RecO (recombination protein O)